MIPVLELADGDRLLFDHHSTRIDVCQTSGVTLLDLDRTVTMRGTYSPFLLFAAARHARWRLTLVPAAMLAMLGYRLKLIDRRRLKEVMQRLLLGRRIRRSALDHLAEAFAEATIRKNLHIDALGLIAREQAEGRLVILTTAAHRYYATPIARRLGITEVIATESRQDDAFTTCRIEGPNCYGPAKAAAVAARLDQMGLDRGTMHLRCYSDDHSDLPVFHASDEPIAVNPSPKLRRHAHQQGWRIISFA